MAGRDRDRLRKTLRNGYAQRRKGKMRSRRGRILERLRWIRICLQDPGRHEGNLSLCPSGGEDDVEVLLVG